YLISGDVLVCFAAAAVCVVLPPFFLSSKKRKRMQLFETQLSDALTVIGNSLRAGFTFQQAMESIVNDMPDPIAKEFGRALREMKLGLPLDRALLNLSERLRHDDLDLLVSAVVIQRQVGGNLADILDNIADTIRDRLKLRGKIKVLTASGRVSGLVIGLLPVFILVFLMIINPDYVRMFFTTPIGIAMMIVALVLESIGFIVVRKVVDIKF
ncbi:MAG: type II secretion system F family protein, partial [Clostridia bacterium]|nr:type II secretion system F family protein [Clostridia bacterium]